MQAQRGGQAAPALQSATLLEPSTWAYAAWLRQPAPSRGTLERFPPMALALNHKMHGELAGLSKQGRHVTVEGANGS